MKTKDDWKKEVDKILAEKVAVAVKQYQEARELAFDELVTLGGQFEAVETKTKKLAKEKSGLNLLVNAQSARSNEIERLFFRLAKEGKVLREQIGAITAKLTVIPPDIAERGLLTFLIQLKKEKL